MEKVKLFDVIQLIGGGQPSKSVFINEPQKGYVRLIQIRDFESDDNAVYVPEDSNLRFIEEDDILLARYGASVGKVLTGKKGAYNVALMKVIPKDGKTIKDFIYYLLMSKQFQFFLKTISVSRAAQAGFSKNDLERFSFYLPSIKQQERIVTQLSSIRVLTYSKKQNIRLYQKLVHSVYTGLFGNPVSNNFGWRTEKLKDIGKWETGGTPSTNHSQYYEGEIPWFTSGELDKLYLKDSIKHISVEALRNSNAKLIKPNSILIGLYDTAAFKMSISTKPCASNQAIIYGKLTNDYYTLFVYYSLLFAKEFYLLKRKGARQKNLNSSFIKNIEVIYPTTVDEERKVNLFYELHDIIQHIKDKQLESLEVLEKMFQSMLQKAFKPNADINEEPIFKDLIKKFTSKDLKGNKQRLQYLINLFEQQNFDNFKDFTEIRTILFELMEDDEIIQTLGNDNNLKLQVK